MSKTSKCKKGSPKRGTLINLSALPPDIQAEVDRLSGCQQAAMQRPTVEQLARIAALLHHADRNEKDHVLASRALRLWRACGRELEEDIQEEIDHRLPTGPAKEPDLWDTIMDTAFPITFEQGLILLMGTKVRLADRHKTFRDAVRDFFRSGGKPEAEVETEMETTLATLRSEGFDLERMQHVARQFEAWRSSRLVNKAVNAARKRWSKKNNKGTEADGNEKAKEVVIQR